jgi:hypothetical protein
MAAGIRTLGWTVWIVVMVVVVLTLVAGLLYVAE